MNDGYTYKEGIVYKNQFHIIWCPKYRRPVLTDGVDIRLKQVLYEIAEEKGITIKALEIMPDHVHIFIDLDQNDERTICQDLTFGIPMVKNKTSEYVDTKLFPLYRWTCQ